MFSWMQANRQTQGDLKAVLEQTKISLIFILAEN